MKKTSDVDSYITRFPPAVRERLERLRATIRRAAPGAEETIRYQMPAYVQGGPVVYFGAYEGHIGFYPTDTGIAAFRDELEGYEHSKGAIRFPHDRPLPLALVRKMVKHRLELNAARGTKKAAALTPGKARGAKTTAPRRRGRSASP